MYKTDDNLVREQIVLRLMGREGLRNFPDDVVKYSFLDLTCLFSMIVEDPGGDGMWLGTLRSGAPQLKSAALPQLFTEAVQNSALRLPPVLKGIGDFISPGEITGEDIDNFYVLTNNRFMFGASAILYPGLLRDVAERLQDDLLLLPSSVHEFLLLPKRDHDPHELQKVVFTINRTQVPDKEVLSDSVYCYSRADDTVRIAAGCAGTA